jgi:hypothetical protein
MAEYIHTNQFLTNFATRYKSPMDIADFIAPPFKVKRPSDKYAIFQKDWMRVYDAKIGGRQEGQEITYDVTSGTYECEEYELSKFISHRARRNADAPFRLDENAVKHLKDAMTIARNKRIIDIAFNTAVVTQTSVPSNKWDNVTSGTPIEDIKTAIIAITNGSAGRQPNKITMSLDVAMGITKTDNFKEYFKYTNSDKLFQIMDALKNLGLTPRIYTDFGVNTNEGGASDPGVESMIGDKVLLHFDDGAPTTDTQTFMYSPFTLAKRYSVDTKKERRGDKHYLYEEIDELLVDATCGYLFDNVL